MKRISSIHRDFTIPFLILVLLSLPFVFFSVDIFIEGFFFDPAVKSWLYGGDFFWQMLYRLVPLMLWSAVISALVLIILSYFKKEYRHYRLPMLFFLTTIALGPGYLVNGTFKEYYGRPRPREIREFSGEKNFKLLLHPGTAGNGQSFPSGHAAAAFAFLGLAFAFRRITGKTNRALFLFALAWGALAGLGRMVQGGHFPSDVLWSAAVCWFTSAFLYHFYFFPLSRKKYFFQKKIFYIPLLFLMILQVLFYTASIRKYKHQVSFDSRLNILKIDPGPLSLSVRQNTAGEGLNIQAYAQSFGFVNSYLKEKKGQDGDTLFYQYYFDRLILRKKSMLVVSMDSTRYRLGKRAKSIFILPKIIKESDN